MLPSRLNSAFFDLLRTGLWGTAPVATFDNLSAADWKGLYEEAVSQTVSGVVYAGIEKLTDVAFPDNTLLARWMVRSLKIAEYNQKVNKAVSQLARMLNDEGIEPVLLKGQATALSYAQPELRECGDIDLYFPDAQEFARACEIIGKDSVTRCKNDGSFECRRNGVVVELHRKMFDMTSRSQQKVLDAAVARYGFCRLNWADDSSVKLLTPAPVPNMLMQSLHILRHLLCFGIGLRQFCDYAVCYKTLTDREKQELTAILRKLNLGKWNNLFMEFLNGYIYGNNPSPAVAPILDIVTATGNFGFSDEQRSWKLIVANNLKLFTTVPRQSLTTLISLLTRQ